MNWLKENWFKASIILVGLLIALALISIAGYYSNISNTPENNIKKSETTRFYLKSIANIRECAGLDCKIIGQYPKNTFINLPYDKIDNLPEWILVSWGNPSSGSGYINKILFSDTLSAENSMPSQDQTQQQSYPTNQRQVINSTSDVFDYWSKSVAFVNCASGGKLSSAGSGVLFKNIYGEYIVLTNQHVVEGTDLCFLSFLTNPTGTIGFDAVTFQGIFAGKLSTDPDDDEYILKPQIIEPKYRTLNLTNDPLSLDFIEKNAIVKSICYRNVVKIGDDVVILGFPAIGSKYGLTLTSGKISGYEGKYYVTDAKIDHGNSGGAAILVKDNCYLGIPTFGIIGQVESLGRILDMSRFGVN
ncbi:MAG: trypsin-like peptidase domain-containing protein [Parcubacteria group bacterium]|nr:trypsin-like peptidase domain-containing protein [Parcubacteria group bacterium]